MQLTKDIYIAIESLRNSYDLLYEHMGAWLSENVRFVDDPASPEDLMDMWNALGVKPEWVDLLVSLRLLWRRGRLEVHSARVEEANLFEDISGALLYLWKFVKFSENRWCTVGYACRAATCALLTGIHSLVERLVLDPRV